MGNKTLEKIMKFLLRDLDSALNAAAPGDKVAVIKKGTNDANGVLSVDVSAEFRQGANLMYAVFTPVTVAANGTISTDSDPVKNGEVAVMIIGGANDTAFVGGVM